MSEAQKNFEDAIARINTKLNQEEIVEIHSEFAEHLKLNLINEQAFWQRLSHRRIS